MNQLQHTVSQVYLKEFGYEEESTNQWKVSVIDIKQVPKMNALGKRWFSQKSIGSFTAYENIFDLPFGAEAERKSFEQQCAVLEDKIPKLISEVKAEKLLSKDFENYLYDYIANLIVRSITYREIVKELLSHPVKRSVLLYEITSSHPHKQENIIAFLNNLKVEDQVNLTMIFMMNYFRYCLSILSEKKNRGGRSRPIFIA